MHCPKCGQQQASDETRFCSRCGFLLSGIADIVANNGLVPASQTGFFGAVGSKKRRGVKQGTFIFLLTFLVVPLSIMVAMATRNGPFLALVAMILFGIGGLLRTVYALMFESGDPEGYPTTTTPALSGSVENRGALPPAYAAPASVYSSPAGAWRDTNDLQARPGSVTDSTTKLLQKDENQ